MSEADFPNRPEGQTYSPISKYGQISIAEQLARLEEIRTGGRRPTYRAQPASQESQWGQIQEGFSQVEGDISWQLRSKHIAILARNRMGAVGYKTIEKSNRCVKSREKREKRQRRIYSGY